MLKTRRRARPLWPQAWPQQTVPRPPAWTAWSLCQGLATGGFDPWHPPSARRDRQQLLFAVARRVCMACPVRLECAADGLRRLPDGGVHGMQGGLTPPELRELARTLGMPERKTAQHGDRSKYVEGCRCTPCQDAQAAYMRDWRGPPKIRARCAGVVHGGAIRRCTQFAVEGTGLCPAHRDQEAA